MKRGNKIKSTVNNLDNKGLFKLKVMYFRLYNLPETFQRMINSIFWELLHEGVLANYMLNSQNVTLCQMWFILR